MSDEHDLEAFERRLAAIDFSGDSGVRAELRGRLLRRASPRPRFPSSVLRVLVLASCLAAALIPALSRARRAASRQAFDYPRGEHGLPVLPGRFDAASSRAAFQPVFEVAQGREVALSDGKAVVWELAGASFRLETRRISPQDLFEKPRLRGVL